MRPIERGDAPRAYRKYQDAAPDLIERLGEYCSYCERRIPVNLAVEHVLPKFLEPASETVWENFLLGCTNCNSVKGDKPVSVPDILWPDLDDTRLAYDYLTIPGLVLRSDTASTKSEALLDLVGLDRVPGHTDRRKRPPFSDRRWQHRLEAYKEATRAFEILQGVDTATKATVRELVIQNARGRGFFSIWIGVFANDPETLRQLIAAFPGTAPTAFDEHGRQTPRQTAYPR